jgi:hypothetical protein
LIRSLIRPRATVVLTGIGTVLVALLVAGIPPVLAGTPTPARTPTPAPATAVLLSQGRPASTSSTENPSLYPPSAAVDGKPGTRWSSGFSDPQWLRLDLGSTATISKVTLTWEAAYARSFKLQTSADAATWTTIYSTTTGTGGTQTVTVTGKGRYFRMLGLTRATRYGYSLWELAVYGTPGPGGSGGTKVSAKKGASPWAFPGLTRAVQDSGVSWYYTWNTTPLSGVGSGPEFVPMIWGPGSVTSSALAEAKAHGKVLLGFNEPDLAGQANMTVDAALALWPKLQATGLRMVSSVVAYGGDTPGGWLDRFMSGAASHGYRVDAIALHWYGGDFTTSNAVNQLKSYLTAVHDRYHKPIWLTEYALMRFGPTQIPSAAQLAAFVTASTAMLESLSFVERYA